MNIARCVHFRDFFTPYCAVEIEVQTMRDAKGRVPCIACGPLAQPARDVRCPERALPSEAEVDAWAADVARRASLRVLVDEEPPL